MAVAGLSLGSYPAAAQVASGARPIGASAHTAHVSSGVPRLGHVFVIVGENTSLRQLTPKRAPYIAGRLRRHAAWLVGYKALANSSSLGNYIEMTSGQSIRCERNNSSPVNLNTDKPICHQNVNNISTNSRCTAQPGKSGTSRCRTRAPSWTAALHGPVTCTRCTTTPPCTTTTSRAPATSRTTTWLPARPASDMSCQWGPQPGTTRPPFDSALRKGVVPRVQLHRPERLRKRPRPLRRSPDPSVRPVRAPGSRQDQSLPLPYGPRSVIVVTWDEQGTPPQTTPESGAYGLGRRSKPGPTTATGPTPACWAPSNAATAYPFWPMHAKRPR